MNTPLRLVASRGRPQWRSRPIIGANPAMIVTVVASHFGIATHELTGICRKRYLSEARWVCMELLQRRGIAHTGIAFFLGRDHSTITHGLARVSVRPDLLGHVAALEAALSLGGGNGGQA